MGDCCWDMGARKPLRRFAVCAGEYCRRTAATQRVVNRCSRWISTKSRNADVLRSCLRDGFDLELMPSGRHVFLLHFIPGLAI